MTRARILLVDEQTVPEPPLKRSLSMVGYKVRTDSRASALSQLDAWRPHLMVIDRSAEPHDGIELCRRVRARSRIPIVMLAKNVSEAETVEALDSGVDQVVTTPCGVSEVLARTRALLRRTNSHSMAPLECGRFLIDFNTRQVAIDGQTTRLTPKELEVLGYLARRPSRVVERTKLLESTWGPRGTEHPEYLRVLIAQLRRKIEPRPEHPIFLVTEAWVGYRFNPLG